MLDISRLAAPEQHGQILFDPGPRESRIALERNRNLLNRNTVRIFGRTLAEWRQRTRAVLSLAPEAPTVVLGHQPEFIHAGVWAKFVVARRLAAACKGQAVNLVVDSDIPRHASIRCPKLRGNELSIVDVPLIRQARSSTYEDIPCWTEAELRTFEETLRAALDDRYQSSRLPSFLAGMRNPLEPDKFAHRCPTGSEFDGVAQLVTGRRSIDACFDVNLEDRRVSRAWWFPILAEIAGNAERFAAVYNAALERYRRRFRVRSPGRPVPPLDITPERIELPVWASRRGEARRRVFVLTSPGGAFVDSKGHRIGKFSASLVAAWVEEGKYESEMDGWRLRPRALLMTLWARLFLADLFLHGIGGAKYDLITDEIIREFLNIEAPAFTCVTATMHLTFPVAFDSSGKAHELRRRLRDLFWNPQRYAHADSRATEWISLRDDAVRRSNRLRDTCRDDRLARKAAFQDIRKASERLREVCQAIIDATRRNLESATALDQARRIAQDREFFIGLLDAPRIQELLDALPAEADFRV